VTDTVLPRAGNTIPLSTVALDVAPGSGSVHAIDWDERPGCVCFCG
jgi:hypothetical protein